MHLADLIQYSLNKMSCYLCNALLGWCTLHRVPGRRSLHWMPEHVMESTRIVADCMSFSHTMSQLHRSTWIPRRFNSPVKSRQVVGTECTGLRNRLRDRSDFAMCTIVWGEISVMGVLSIFSAKGIGSCSTSGIVSIEVCPRLSLLRCGSGEMSCSDSDEISQFPDKSRCVMLHPMFTRLGKDGSEFEARKSICKEPPGPATSGKNVKDLWLVTCVKDQYHKGMEFIQILR